MPNVKVAIGFWREPRPDLATSERQVLLQALRRVADVHPSAIAETDSGVDSEVLVRHTEVIPMVCGSQCFGHNDLGVSYFWYLHLGWLHIEGVRLGKVLLAPHLSISGFASPQRCPNALWLGLS